VYNISEESTRCRCSQFCRHKGNPHLKKFGGILANIPGDAILHQVDGDGETCDLDESAIDELEEIVKKDMIQRNKMMNYYLGDSVAGSLEEFDGMLKVGVGMIINGKLFIVK
jgi:hypothetical protein